MKRITELDTLRGLAALAIVFYHMHPDASFGWTRVDLFLVLSGFLVTSIVLKYVRTLKDLPTFYVRRVIRIWPCYFLALGVIVGLNPLLNQPFALDGLPYYLTFTQNLPYYWGSEPPAFSSYFFHTWTLAIIEQFYLLWPMLLCLLGPRRIIPVGLALVIASVASRSAGLNPWVLLARCDGLVMGGLLAVIMADGQRVQRWAGRFRWSFALMIMLAAAILACSLAAKEGTAYHESMTVWPALTVFGSALLYTGLIGLVVTFSGHRWLAPLRSPRLTILGTISYGLYLYHPIVLVAVARAGRTIGFNQSPWIDLIMIGSAIGVAIASWRLFEKPITGLKSRFPFQRTPSPGPEPRAVFPSSNSKPAEVATGSLR